MKIHAYKVVPLHEDTQPFEKALADLAQQQLPERLYRQRGLKLRLEDHGKREGLVELNFVTFRMGSAPVRVADDRPVAEIAIAEDESFGEETACLYNPATRFLLMQYNHYGPRASAIRESMAYEEDGVAHGYDFAPKLSPASEQRIRNLGVVSRVEVTFSIPDLVNAPAHLSVDSAIDLARANGAQRLEVAIASRGGLLIGPITDWLAKLHRLSGREDSAIQKLAVRASEGEDGPRETIDLLADRLCRDWPLPQRAGRRQPLEARLAALRLTHQEWQAAGHFR
jgi:hypothetical protein